MGRAVRLACGLATVAVALLTLAAAPASAGTHTWTGGTSNGLWSTKSNWQDGSRPAPGESNLVVEFNGNTTSRMDLADLSIQQLKLSGNQNVINTDTGGAILNLRGPGDTVLNAGNDNRINVGLTLADGPRVSVNSTSGILTIASTITGSASSGIQFRGGSSTTGSTVVGRLALSGDAVVESGLLSLSSNASDLAATGPRIVVGEGTAAFSTATLRLGLSFQIGESTDVVVGGNGIFDMTNGTADDIDGLTVNGGQVKIGSPGRLLAGPVDMDGGAGSQISGSGTLALRSGATATGTSTSAGTPVISSKVELGTGTTIAAADGFQNDDLRLTGVIGQGSSSPAAALTKTGAGTLALQSTAKNTYAGGTFIKDGALTAVEPTSEGAFPSGTGITVGDGAGSPATLKLSGRNTARDNSVVVESDGTLDLPGAAFIAPGVTVRDGRIKMNGGELDSGLSMTGGTVEGGGRLLLGSLTATSSAAGPARIAAEYNGGPGLGIAPVMNVPSGPTQPELELTGDVTGGYSSTPRFRKLGGGTAVFSGTNRLPGSSIEAGTFVMNGSQPGTGATSVAQGATLAGSGTLQDVTVSGRLAPVDVLTTKTLRFTPTGELRAAAVGASLPRVDANGTVTIDPGAQLNATLPNAATAGGTQHALIANDGSDGVTGQFANAPDGMVFTSSFGVPFTARYAAGDGNDLTVTAGNAAPGVAVRPAADVDTTVGTPIAFGADTSDANGDPVAIGWDYGDGMSGSGAEAPHAYAAAGTYTARVTVDDGKGGTATATRVVRVAPGGGALPGDTTPRDTLAPKLTVAVAKKQKLSRKGVYTLKLTCDEDCTVTLAASIKPPGRGAKTSKTTKTIKLKAGKATAVKLTVPKTSVRAVRKALGSRKAVTVNLTGTAKDATGNAGKVVKAKTTLKP